MQSPCSPWGLLRIGWLLLGHSFKQHQTNAIRSLKMEKIQAANNRTADQSKRVKASLPQSSSCHVVGQPFDTVVQAALVQSNRVSLWGRTKKSVSVSDSSRLELCWTFLVLRFLLSSLARMKPFKRLTGSNGQPTRGSLWRRTKESVSVPDSSDLNFSRSAISAFIPRTDETSSENHKTLSRFDFERLLILLGYLETDY